LNTTYHVVSDAVVAAQYRGSNKTHKLFWLHVQSAFFVSACVQRKEPLNIEVVGCKDALVHLFAVASKLFKSAQSRPRIAINYGGDKTFMRIIHTFLNLRGLGKSEP